MPETETIPPESGQDTPVESSSDLTIEEIREELAKMYLTFLDQQKGGILATGASVGVNLNPFMKDGIEYLTSENVAEDKKDIFSIIGKNIKKKFIEKIGGGATMLEYNKAKLNKMRALIMANKNNKAELEALITQINSGIDPTIEAGTAFTAIGAGSKNTSEGQRLNEAEKRLDEVEIKRKEYLYPVVDANGNPIKINSPVGERGPIEGVIAKTHIHKGIDIAAPEGTPLLAVHDGEVESVGFGDSTGFSGYGNYIVIKLKNGYRVLYGHMKTLAEKKDGTTWKVGDIVRKGEQIGLMGSTGMSTGSHLHFEIREGKFNESETINYFHRQYLDPIAILPVTKDMVNENILARCDESVFMDTSVVTNDQRMVI